MFARVNRLFFSLSSAAGRKHGSAPSLKSGMGARQKLFCGRLYRWREINRDDNRCAFEPAYVEVRAGIAGELEVPGIVESELEMLVTMLSAYEYRQHSTLQRFPKCLFPITEVSVSYHLAFSRKRLCSLNYCLVSYSANVHAIRW